MDVNDFVNIYNSLNKVSKEIEDSKKELTNFVKKAKSEQKGNNNQKAPNVPVNGGQAQQQTTQQGNLAEAVAKTSKLLEKNTSQQTSTDLMAIDQQETKALSLINNNAEANPNGTFGTLQDDPNQGLVVVQPGGQSYNASGFILNNYLVDPYSTLLAMAALKNPNVFSNNGFVFDDNTGKVMHNGQPVNEGWAKNVVTTVVKDVKAGQEPEAAFQNRLNTLLNGQATGVAKNASNYNFRDMNFQLGDDLNNNVKALTNFHSELVRAHEALAQNPFVQQASIENPQIPAADKENTKKEKDASGFWTTLGKLGLGIADWLGHFIGGMANASEISSK